MGLWQLETTWVYWAMLAFVLFDLLYMQRRAYLSAMGFSEPQTVRRGPWAAPDVDGESRKWWAWMTYALEVAILLCLLLRTPLAILPAFLAMLPPFLSLARDFPLAKGSSQTGEVVGAFIGEIAQFGAIIAATIFLSPDLRASLGSLFKG